MEGCDERRDHAGQERVETPADLEHEQRRSGGNDDLGYADDEPGAVERPVERCEKPCVQRLGVGGRQAR